MRACARACVRARACCKKEMRWAAQQTCERCQAEIMSCGEGGIFGTYYLFLVRRTRRGVIRRPLGLTCDDLSGLEVLKHNAHVRSAQRPLSTEQGLIITIKFTIGPYSGAL